MKLSDLLDSYPSHKKYSFIDIIAQEKKKNADIENTQLSEKIVSIIEKFNLGEEISKTEMDNFEGEFKKLDYGIQVIIKFLLDSMISEILEKQKNEEEFKQIISDIESVSDRKKTGTDFNDNIKKYIKIINSNIFALKNLVYFKDLKPNCFYMMNTLILSGELPKKFLYCGVEFGNPIHDLYDRSEMDEKEIKIRRGVKSKSDYYPLKAQEKLERGDSCNAVVMASNNKKILYIRQTYNPTSVLSSKIASLIDKTVFSSERVINNGTTGSRKLPGYVMPASAGSQKYAPKEQTDFYKKRKDLIENQKKIFKNTGTIDEVLNFVQEGDANSENFGFSSKNLEDKDCYMVKIDFDCCSFSNINQEAYEKDILTKFPGGIYKNQKHISENDRYLKEKLVTRLKL